MNHRKYFSQDPNHPMSYENYLKGLQDSIACGVDTVLLMQKKIKEISHKKGTGELSPETADKLIEICKDIGKMTGGMLTDYKKELEEA